MPKKKFIDKKNAITFHLVHRSQQDPLAADETAPQRVLLPINDAKTPKHSTPESKDKQLEEQQKYGIFFDDDYNYLQHLKDGHNVVEWVPVETQKKEDKKLKLPSSVFASVVEEDVGLLNKAAPTGLRLDVDPEVVAAMDEDFDFSDPDNELEDNFMELANAECSDGDYEDADDARSDVSSNFEEEAMDEVASLDGGQYSFDDEETKSRFTDYSMSSSVIRRNDQLTFLDDRFEKMYEKYDENEIGALDCEEIEGYVPESADILLQYADKFAKQQKSWHLDKDNVLLRAKLAEIEDSDSEDDELVNVEVKPKEKWDCESILSTYSNIYNHPKLIREPNKIKLNKHGIPIETNRLTAKALSKLEDSTMDGATKSVGAHSVLSTLSTLSLRPKGETVEERKERKQQLKEFKRERRVEKKANTEAFRDEAKRQVKININNKNNIQGNRIL